MENNKILISIYFQFKQDPKKEEQFGKNTRHSVELYVPRDLTLRQLLTGIRFGLEKARVSGADTKRMQACWGLFYGSVYHCKKNSEGKYESHDGQYIILKRNNKERFRLNERNLFELVKIERYHEERAKNLPFACPREGKSFHPHVDHLDLPLHQLGFITSTALVITSEQFLVDDAAGNVHSFSTKEIVDAFNPAHKPETLYPYPEYNISTRERYQFDLEPVNIISASNPPQKPEADLMAAILPGVLSMSMMAILRSANTGFDIGTVAMALAMGGVTSLSTTIRFSGQKKQYRENLEKWRKEYTDYVERTIRKLELRLEMDSKKLDELYPDVEQIADKLVYRYSDNIFSRSRTDDDFMSFRLGTSNRVKTMFEIAGERKDEVFSEAGYVLNQKGLRLYLNEESPKGGMNNLSQLPEEIRKRYEYMPEAPLVYSLKNNGILGIVDRNMYGGSSVRTCERFYNSCANLLIKRMLFELCYYHSPEDLQIVLFMPREDHPAQMHKAIHDYKYLPHFRELLRNRSQFVFNEKSAGNVLGELLNILNDRSQTGNGEDEKAPQGHYPHIVLVVLEEYNLKEHAFAQYLPKAPETGKEYSNDLGISFVFASTFKEYLPAYCNHVVRLEPKDACMTLMPREDVRQVQPFVPWNSVNTLCFAPDSKRAEQWQKLINSKNMLAAPQKTLDIYKKAFEFFSGIYYTQIAQNGKVPTSVDMFDLMGLEGGGIRSIIEDAWDLDTEKTKRAASRNPIQRKYDVAKTLKVPLGRTDSGIAYLNLHEKEDGPHMLVAGTTGSGKSETVISWLLALCMYYRPDELNLLLVDMKGGGFTKRLGDLPHVVGTVTDVDGDENGTGAEYMLRRFLEAITYEVKRRKILLNKMMVDNVDDYIKVSRSIESHIKSKGVDPRSETADEMRRLARDEKLSHLILVIDEFTELKRFTAESNDVDFIGQITTIARVGRSLGYHICLISQNIQGAITEDISVNSKSRLCLKVATRQASKEMIGNELAADPSMPGMGRAYLLVGTGSKFEYFQSAYSGAKVTLDPESRDDGQVDKIAYELTQANLTGQYTKFYHSGEDNPLDKKRTEELREQGKLKTQLEVIVEAIRQIYEQERMDKHADGLLCAPHQVFLPPLPKRVVLLDDKTHKVLEK